MSNGNPTNKKQINDLNAFRISQGLQPILTKKRSCMQCKREFISVMDRRNCGCISDHKRDRLDVIRPLQYNVNE